MVLLGLNETKTDANMHSVGTISSFRFLGFLQLFLSFLLWPLKKLLSSRRFLVEEKKKREILATFVCSCMTVHMSV